MWITTRDATRLLTSVVSGEAQARSLLRAGMAGPPLPTSAGDLHDESAVLALAARPVLDPATAHGRSVLAERCPHGLYIARLRRNLPLDLTRPWAEAVEAAAGVPVMPVMTAALLDARVRAWGGLPWVATLCGFVALGGELTGRRPQPAHRATTSHPQEGSGHRFALDPPGEWYDTLAEIRLPTGPGGRPWQVWLPGPREAGA